jgi:hypothetical protein
VLDQPNPVTLEGVVLLPAIKVAIEANFVRSLQELVHHLSGHLLHVFNTADAAEDILVVASDTTTFVARIPQGGDALLACNGTAWRAKDRRRLAVLTATLAADRVLTAAEIIAYDLIVFDPGGAARNVDLPGQAQGLPDSDGVYFLIMNAADAAENLVVRNPAGATVVTLNQNERAWVVGTGGAAWTHMGVETIALT